MEVFKQVAASKAAAQQKRKKSGGGEGQCRVKQQRTDLKPQSREEAAMEQAQRGRTGGDEKKQKRDKSRTNEKKRAHTEDKAAPTDSSADGEKKQKKLKKQKKQSKVTHETEEMESADNVGSTDASATASTPLDAITDEATNSGRTRQSGSDARQRAAGRRRLQKATADLGYYSASGFGKHSAVHSRAGLDATGFFRWSLVKRMLRHTHGYATGGHTSENSQAKSYRQKAMQHPYSKEAKRLMQTQNTELLRRIINQCALVAAETGKSRITCSSVSTVLRPLADALDLRVDAPPNSLVAAARMDGQLPHDPDPSRRAAQAVDIANYRRSVHSTLAAPDSGTAAE